MFDSSSSSSSGLSDLALLQQLSDWDPESDEDPGEGSNSKDADSPREDSSSHDSWSFFERTEEGARCAVCREPVPPASEGRRRHLREHHPKLLHSAESEEDTANNTQEEVYTEVLYLDNDDSPKKIIKIEEKHNAKTPRKSAVTRKRRVSSSSDEEPLEQKRTRNEDEIDQFTKYITCLLRKLPQDACTELQMDIVNLIIKKQLELKRNETPVLAANKPAQTAQPADDTEKEKSSNGYGIDNVDVSEENINEQNN